jgi:uncharacterized repeat protein (TIGR01451 family)
MVKTLGLLTALLVSLLFIKPVFADVSCTTQYGGGQTCVSTGQLLVNKHVFDPDVNGFVDNTTHAFKAGQGVNFTVDVKNVGDITLSNIHLVDTLPGFLEWAGGDPLDLTISSLAPGEMVTKTIQTRVKGDVGTANMNCQANLAVATASNGMSDRDTASLCVGQLPPKTPASGPEGLILVLPLGAAGYFLRKIRL